MVVLAWMEFSVFWVIQVYAPRRLLSSPDCAKFIDYFPSYLVGATAYHWHQSYCGSEGTLKNIRFVTFFESCITDFPFMIKRYMVRIPSTQNFFVFFWRATLGGSLSQVAMVTQIIPSHRSVRHGLLLLLLRHFSFPPQILSGGRLDGRWSRGRRRRRIPGPTFFLLDCVSVCVLRGTASRHPPCRHSPGRILEQDIPGNTLALTMGKISGFF